MNQKYTYESVDMICFHSECINKQQQLFRYNSDKGHHSKHLLEQCSTLHIYNLHKLQNYQQKMIYQLTLGFDQQVLNEMQVKLEQLKVNISERYKQYSHQLYQNYIRNCPKLLNQELLAKIKQKDDPTQEVNLINTLYAEKQGISKKLLSSILQPIFQQLQKQMQEVIIRIQNLIEQTTYIFRDEKNNQNQLKLGNNQVMREKESQICCQLGQQPKETQRKYKPIAKVRNKKLYQYKTKDKNDEDSEVRSKIGPKRRNIYDILSRNKRTDQFMKKNKKNEQMTSQQMQISQKKSNINFILQQNQIEEEAIHQESSISINQDLYYGMNQESIYELGSLIQKEDQQIYSEELSNSMQILTHKVSEKYDQVLINSHADVQKAFNIAREIESQKIIIFYKIPQEILIALINKLKPTKIILNCKIILTQKINYQVQPRILKKIEFFEQHWDHNTYFFQIAKSKHFPSHYQNYTQPSKKNHFKAYFLSKLKSIKNVWISSPNDLLQLQKSQLNVNKLQYLRLEPCICCKNSSFFSDSLKYFKDVTSLKTIIVKRCNIYGQNRQALRDLLRKNHNLECVFLENNLKIQFNYLSILQQLKISKLAVINESCSNFILKSDDLFTLINLRYLYLNSVQIIKIKNYQIKLKSMQKSELELIARFKKLQNLTFLDLYNSNIYPYFIAFLHPKVYLQLTYLNLGYTMIDNQVTIQHLRRFKSLTYLQLDGTSLDLQKFFSPKKNNYRISKTIKYLSLRWFTGNQNQSTPKYSETIFYPLNQRNFELLVQSFPKVEYLNISDSRDVIGQVNFKNLVYLKYLCVDQRYTKMEQFIEKMNKLQISVFKRKQTNYVR